MVKRVFNEQSSAKRSDILQKCFLYTGSCPVLSFLISAAGLREEVVEPLNEKIMQALPKCFCGAVCLGNSSPGQVFADLQSLSILNALLKTSPLSERVALIIRKLLCYGVHIVRYLCCDLLQHRYERVPSGSLVPSPFEGALFYYTQTCKISKMRAELSPRVKGDNNYSIIILILQNYLEKAPILKSRLTFEPGKFCKIFASYIFI